MESKVPIQVDSDAVWVVLWISVLPPHSVGGVGVIISIWVEDRHYVKVDFVQILPSILFEKQ